MTEKALITVGISPCWDLTCCVDGIEWGDHKRLVSQSLVPAGKALNISRTLNWLAVPSIAAGLWGRSDYSAMIDLLAAACPFVQPAFTVVDGKTRTNLTVVDTVHRREMHLRADCELATDESLKRLGSDLASLPDARLAVFAGSMPQRVLDSCLSLIRQFQDRGTPVAVDTSGAALAAVVREGGLYLIKPNLEELGELLGRQIGNDTASVIAAGRGLCDAVEIVLVSRGADGALAITKDAAIGCRVVRPSHDVVNTVGCGDHLLAGFLSQGVGDIRGALEIAVKVATARAWGLTETMSAEQAIAEIELDVAVY